MYRFKFIYLLNISLHSELLYIMPILDDPCKTFSESAFIGYTVNPVYSERVCAAKSVHLRRVFTINVINLTIN